MGCVFAPAPPAAAQNGNSLSETLDERRERLVKEYRERRQATRREWKQENFRVFMNESGVITLTNKPEEYRSKNGYNEVDLQLQPVAVPDWYQERPKTSSGQNEIGELVEHYARMYRLDRNLVYAVIKVESNFNVRAVSSKDCKGLMQLAPGTAKDLGVSDEFDPGQNIAGGAQYLAKMLQLFNNNVRLALAGYNAGPNAVKSHGGIPPYEETQNYVKKVLAWVNTYERHGFHPGSELSPSPQSPQRGTRVAMNRPPQRDYYTIHFKSGLTQPAEAVHERGNYYLLQLRGRKWQIRKDLVEKILEPT